MRITHCAVMRLLMSAFYLVAGMLHIMAPDGFLAIVPDAVPWPETTVIVTGLCEIAGAAGLMTKHLRRAAGIALAAYAVCVFPANIKHALFMVPVAGLPVSWWYHGPRLALQPVLVWWALYCGGVTDWPFGAKR
jgi:uncharacterized membrane protein